MSQNARQKKISIEHPAYFVVRKVATLHFTKMGLDAQLTTFVSVNFIAFNQFSTEICARL